MTEHERDCPRCGEPAHDHRFCPSCGLNIASLSEMPTRTEWQDRDASDAIAQGPREAVWSGQGLSAVESNGVGDHIPGETSAASVSEIESDRPPAEDATAEGPAEDNTAESASESVLVDPVPLRDDAQPGMQHDRSRSVVGLWIARRSRSQRVAFLCLAAVIGLVVVLTSRDLRRYF